MELPLVPYVTALLYPLLGFNVYSVRLITLLSFLLVVVYVFRLTKRELGPMVGLLAALSAAIMPLYHEFGRILFSEPPMIAMSVLGLYHFAEWVDFHRRSDWFLAAIGFSLAVALKLEPLYLLLPLLWIAFRKYKFRMNMYRGFILFVVCSLILPLVWYSYAYYLKQTSIDVFGIFSGHNKLQTFTMLSDPAWYQTMYGRITWNILGGKIGMGLFLVGFCGAALIRKGKLFFLYLLSIGCHFAIVAEGQIDAPYRQLPIIPSISVFVALGAVSIIMFVITLAYSFFNLSVIRTGKILSWIALIPCLFVISTIGFKRWDMIRAQDPSIPYREHKWELAQEIRRFAGPESKLVAVGEYTVHVGGNDLSPVLYYYAGIQGWTIQAGGLDLENVQHLIGKGATHLTVMPPPNNPTEDSLMRAFIEELKVHYKVLFEDYDDRGRVRILFDLRQT
jgi:4-amino-4-deoxy-L-arabinose transferase-like glycosyltransferase